MGAALGGARTKKKRLIRAFKCLCWKGSRLSKGEFLLLSLSQYPLGTKIPIIPHIHLHTYTSPQSTRFEPQESYLIPFIPFHSFHSFHYTIAKTTQKQKPAMLQSRSPVIHITTGYTGIRYAINSYHHQTEVGISCYQGIYLY